MPDSMRARPLAIALLLACAGVGSAWALPQRTLVARPLPPSVLAAAESNGGPRLTVDSARLLADSLLGGVSSVRGLKSLRPVPVLALDRSHIRARLEEITRQDGIEPSLRQEETLLRWLGLVPPDADLVRIYHDLLEEQVAGFYDIDRRDLVLADWVPRQSQAVVLEHELVHALQDQHFSLRVRKRLGFDNPDAEAAWHALIEGDATAVMAEMELVSTGAHFPALLDSGTTVTLASPAARAAAGGYDSERFRAAPASVRQSLAFPYVSGMRYVASLFRTGGWPAVDAAFVHPPVSTEQILHPDRVDNAKDLPVRIALPDLGGMLGEGYRLLASGVLGEQDLLMYLAQYVDHDLASVACDGWAGCAWALYGGDASIKPLFVLSSTWDSDDDAVEFFGGVIGTLEARYPQQTGYTDASTQDQILWNEDKDGKVLNVLRVREKQVLCVEMLPSTKLQRVLGKLDTATLFDDPAPEVRAHEKGNLPWNRLVRPVGASAMTLQMDLPDGWTLAPAGQDSSVLLAATRGTARLQVQVDRHASREIGLDGHAHAVASAVQKHGKGIYVQTDVNYPRKDAQVYQHIFTQYEGEEQFAYYIAVFDLTEGMGTLTIRGSVEKDPGLEPLFYSLLETVRIVPAVLSDATLPVPPRGN